MTQEVHHGVTFNYQYDKDGQLTSTTRSDQSTPAVQSYDANGNRTDSGAVIGADNRVLSDSQFTYQYDNEGNLIQKVDKSSGDITSYVYDFRNRLTDVTTTSPGGIVLHSEHYTYDVFDRRIAVTVNGATLYTVYDGDNAWADYNASGAVQARYLFGDNTDEIIARWQPGTGTAWYLTDQLGTVRDIINAGGQVIDHIDYSAFGAVLSETNPAAGDRFKFTGREYDTGTGLYYFRGRYYDPVQGRFLNEDPLGFFAGDANLYRYIGNQPTAGTDPFGDDALVERALEFQGNLFSAAAQAQIAAAINSSFNLLEAWAQDRLTAADLQMALDEVQSAGSKTLFAPLTAFGNAINATGGFIQDVLNGAWKSAAYRDQLFQNISSTVVNSAFGLIMGPLGGPLMTIAAPQLLLTQVAFNGINALEAYQYYQQTGDSRLLLVRSMRAGVNIGLTLMQWRLNLSPTCNCLGHCFPAGTLVSTECGQRPIESIRPGERVWAMDLKDGQWKLRHVMETFTRLNDGDLLSLKYRDGAIQVTPGHPFWVVRGSDLESRPWPAHAGERLADAAIPGRWVDAGDLRVGDAPYLRGGEERLIEEIQVLAGGQRVYNFRVEELACYGVGSAEVLVHNTSRDKIAKRMGVIAESKGWKAALASGEKGIACPNRKNTNTPGLDYATFDPTDNRIKIYDAKYRKNRRYPTTVSIAKQTRWTQELRQFLTNEYTGSDKQSLLQALNQGKVDFKVFGWPR